MHQELNTPDTLLGGVATGCGGPRGELFGEGADVWPFSGAGEGVDFFGGGAEGGELFWG
jgi:hypothetical protein